MRKILFFLLLGIFIFLTYIAVQPPQYQVAREITISASAETIFPYINNAKKMNSWNPWIELAPKSKVTFSGPEEGVNATTSWTGDENLGTGSATVVESIPNSLVKTRLEYTKPYVMTQAAQITLKPTSNQTIVRWSVSGENTFVGRLFCYFMDMDKMVGGAFEKGLAKLKILIEGENS